MTKLPKKAYPGKIHPYQRIIAEMREILLEMGFEELYGGIVQQSFWNFDALFQPQDHPAREMQDTFYLRETLPLPTGYEKVKAMHISGGETSSTGWGGVWKEEKAEQCVLRTHTTSLSIQHLAQNPNPPVKAFCYRQGVPARDDRHHPPCRVRAARGDRDGRGCHVRQPARDPPRVLQPHGLRERAVQALLLPLHRAEP